MLRTLGLKSSVVSSAATATLCMSNLDQDQAPKSSFIRKLSMFYWASKCSWRIYHQSWFIYWDAPLWFVEHCASCAQEHLQVLAREELACRQLEAEIETNTVINKQQL